MRGADAGNAAMLQAKPAFWTGLLYDDAAQKAAAALIRGWTVEEMRALRAAVPRQALKATIRGRSLQDIARDAVAIARDGLVARGLGEEVYLAPLEDIAASGMTQAERWLQRHATAWGGDVTRIFAEAEV
jgi:glutamate--cysteine ligase